MDTAFVYAAVVTISLREQASELVFSCKPLAADEVFWEITADPEGIRQPLSFRVWGAFVCDRVPLERRSIQDAGMTPVELAETVLRDASSLVETQRPHSIEAFAQTIEEHENYAQRGAYLNTLVCTLIALGRLREARVVLEQWNVGRSPVGTQTIGGIDFRQLALSWLDAQQALGSDGASRRRTS